MKLSVAEWGRKDGLPVVLLHGFPMSARLWEPQRAALEAYRALAPDFRGFGGTPLAAPWLVEHAVDDLLETMTALGVEKAVLVGLSMGGYVALRAVEKAPGRVRALVLADTRAEADANENKLKRAAAIDFVKAKGTAAFVDPFLHDALAPKTLSERPKAVEFLKGVANAATPDALAAALMALAARHDMTPALPKITVPTAVLVGAQDKITPLPLSEAMRSRIPGAELHVIPDAGHFSNAENPGAFNERLLGFLRRLS